MFPRLFQKIRSLCETFSNTENVTVEQVNTLAVCCPRLRLQSGRSQLVICGSLLHPQPEEGPHGGAKQPTRVAVVFVVVVVNVVAAASAVITVVVVINIIIIIIIIIIIVFILCIYTYITETNYVSCLYNVVAILYLRIMVHVMYFECIFKIVLSKYVCSAQCGRFPQFLIIIIIIIIIIRTLFSHVLLWN